MDVVSTLRAYRVPLSTATAALLFAVTLAVVPGFTGMPWVVPTGWANVPLLYWVLIYTIASGSIGIASCVVRFLPRCQHSENAAAKRASLLDRGIARISTGQSAAVPPSAPVPADQRVPAEHGRFTPLTLAEFGEHVSRRHHLVASAIFGALVLLQGIVHSGPLSGAWRVGWPTQEAAVATADGYVFWLDGMPLQSDTAPFVEIVQSFMRRIDSASISQTSTGNEVRSGRAAYPFLVTLVARVVSPVGGLYTAFVTVNIVFWWAASLAVYDLARIAYGSWWIGLAAGVLTATGVGFIFMVGNAMSACAGYGAVAVILWLMIKFRVLSEDTPRRDKLLVACQAGALSLLNSLGPLLLLFAGFQYVGRVSLRALVLWSLALLGVGEAWSRVMVLFDRGIHQGNDTAQLLGAGAVAIVLISAVVLVTIPHKLAECLIAGCVLIGAPLFVAFAVLAPQQFTSALNTGLSGLHLPSYLPGAGNMLTTLLGPYTANWDATPEQFRSSYFVDNVFGAFPPLVCILALVGFVRLGRDWREWAFAVFVSASIVTYMMNTVSGTPHPRLVFWAFPAIYLLAAGGLGNVYRAAHTTIARVAPRRTRICTVGASVIVLALLIPAIAISNASLVGDWYFLNRFHAASII